jgi:hypothetical protein
MEEQRYSSTHSIVVMMMMTNISKITGKNQITNTWQVKIKYKNIKYTNKS